MLQIRRVSSLRRRVSFALAPLLLASMACSMRSSPEPLVVAYDSLLVTLDPHHHNEGVTWSVLGNFYDGLVRFSPAMTLEPALAESWVQLSPTTWRFDLRQGARFHDGRPVEAADVVASFERAVSDPRSLVRHHLGGIERLTVEGESTVGVETRRPTPTLLNRLAFLFVVPRDQASSDEITFPVGTGPYRFVGRESDGSIRAEAFDGWWGRPEIRQVHLVFDDDAQVLLRRFLGGEIDVLNRIDDEAAEVRTRRDLRVQAQPRLAVQLLAVNVRGGGDVTSRALADVRVRRALLLALDRERWSQQCFVGNATAASQLVHPVVFGFDPSIRPVAHDAAEARRLLEEAGFPDGFEVTLGHGRVPPAIVAAIVADLGAIGVTVNPAQTPFGELLSRARDGQFQLLYYAWDCSTGDASDLLDAALHSRTEDGWFGAENFTGYGDPVTDALIEEADREMDAERRLQLLQEVQRLVLADLPLLPLNVRWGNLGLSARAEVVSRHDAWLWFADWRWRTPLRGSTK